jgi:hypothetical protein
MGKKFTVPDINMVGGRIEIIGSLTRYAFGLEKDFVAIAVDDIEMDVDRKSVV